MKRVSAVLVCVMCLSLFLVAGAQAFGAGVTINIALDG
jgi:hypothetical protein